MSVDAERSQHKYAMSSVFWRIEIEMYAFSGALNSIYNKSFITIQIDPRDCCKVK